MNRNALSPILGTAMLAATLTLAGCSSPSEPRDLMAEEARSGAVERPVAMKGEGLFDGGKIHVVATVSRGFVRSGKGAGAKIARAKNGWFHKGEADAFKEDYSFDYGDSEEQQKEAVQEYIRQARARAAAGSPMPPVTLHVSFENKGTEPLEIVPTDVNSDLGNFVVSPPKLKLAPGEKGALDPMVSQLGVTSDDIPVTVSIRIGGKAETQIISVKNILAPSLRNPS